MKMETFGTFIVLLLTGLVLSGCGAQDNNGTGAFIGGTEGLTTEYLPGNPPDAIFDQSGSSFAIVVKLQNVGEDSIKSNEGYIKINGLDPGSYGTRSFKKNFDVDISGAKKNFDGTVLNGGIATVEFGDLKYTSEIQGNLEQTVWADACYKYTTKMTAQICVKKDPQQSLADKKICEVEGEKSPQNSGAPIQVTSLKESFAGNGKVGVTMIISHQGKGDNFFKDTDGECNDVESNNNRGKVHVKLNAVKIGGRDVYPQCTGFSDSGSGHEGYIRLFKDGSGKEQYSLYCTVDAGSTDSVFEVPIDAELTYLYLQHVEKSIIIRHTAK